MAMEQEMILISPSNGWPYAQVNNRRNAVMLSLIQTTDSDDDGYSLYAGAYGYMPESHLTTKLLKS